MFSYRLAKHILPARPLAWRCAGQHLRMTPTILPAIVN
jgi:hypothetical protein